MRILLIALLLLGACRGQEQDGANGAASPAADEETGSGGAPSAGAQRESATAAALTGLWESRAGARRNQLCMIGEGNKAEFGLIIFGEGGHNCSGAGGAVRQGERLTLTMTGDRSCSIPATLSGGTLTLAGTIPDGCSYYCAAGARLAGTRFERIGNTRADALKAKDFADDPLCG